MQEQMREKIDACGEGKSTKVAQRASSNQTFFTVPKGVTTFDFCKNRNLLVTGGMDKLLRMWMPYVPRCALYPNDIFFMNWHLSDSSSFNRHVVLQLF